MTKNSSPRFVESTAGQVAAELARRGIAPDQRVTIAIEPDDWLTRVRDFARPRVRAEDWSDADIDKMIDAARDDVQSSLCQRCP